MSWPVFDAALGLLAGESALPWSLEIAAKVIALDDNRVERSGTRMCG